MQHLLNGVFATPIEAVELHVHRDRSPHSSGIIFLEIFKAFSGCFFQGCVFLQESFLRRAAVGHGEVLMDVDVVSQVVIVVDRCAGLAGDIVEGNVMSFGVIFQSMVQLQKKLSFLTHCGVFPFTVLDRDLVLVVVNLDVERLQDRSADQERRTALDDEGLDVAWLAFDVDWKSDRPV